MRAKNEVHVTVYDSTDRLPWKLAEFSDWVARQTAKIPEEYRNLAEIDITAKEEDYDGDYNLRFTIDYWRPETQEEIDRREGMKRTELNLRELDEKRLLAELLAKYGQDGAGVRL